MQTFCNLALVALQLSVLFIPSSLAGAVPKRQTPASSDSTYWVSTIKRQGTAAFSSNSYTIYRNVMDFGAKGDGSTDDTAAINSAISSGNRCGDGCDSSTTTPAIVYFPPGTYMISEPLIQYYYTQFIGDALTLPTIKALPSFKGIAMIDSDPYDDDGANWYTNQNNFYRQVRNFVLDITALPANQGACIHWQVAQATSLQNIVFNMVPGNATSNTQSGVWMDNGSGGFMTDLVFNGGGTGAFLGNQQFTTRNLTFNNVQTAIYMNWNWVWNFKSLSINNCGVGLNMSSGGFNQSVGSIIIQDSVLTNTPIGILTEYNKAQNVPVTGGTLILDNVDFTGSQTAVSDASGGTVLAGGSKIASWGQGNAYTTGATSNLQKRTNVGSASQVVIQGDLVAPSKPASLLDSSGAFFERSKPQYETVPSSSFLSVKSNGAVGDGVTDDTAAIQAVLNKATANQIVYFDHGAYLITSTVKVPKNIKITGEIWPLIMASGSAFADQSKPTPVFQVGQTGDSGAVEMSDLIFTTKGPVPGAVMVEWNVAEPAGQQGASGMWDVHMRIGGSAGTDLQSNTCAKNPNVTHAANSNCKGAFLLLHITDQATIYMENNWFWVADHELDLSDHNQVDIYSGRGILIESSKGPVWLYGTSAEHSTLYNYQVSHAANVYMGLIQTETPYFQSNPTALTPFAPQTGAPYYDPSYYCPQGAPNPNNTGGDNTCVKSWGLRVVDSNNIHIYGAGLYSFFDNYSEDCLATESCQASMVSIEGCGTGAADSGVVNIWGLSTKGSTSMVDVDGTMAVAMKDNMNGFCQTIAVFEGV
ncbi:MAG: hypothetical protein MMC33_009871 [Icmadophila ericetorum]|nr:hypothetical protein [Icmadophila ericetorum]